MGGINIYNQDNDPILTACMIAFVIILLLIKIVLPIAGIIIGCILSRKNKKWLILSVICLSIFAFLWGNY